MSCAVTQHLPEDDSSDVEAERLVHSSMRIVKDLRPTGRERSRRRFRPKEYYDFQLETDEGDVVILRAYRRKGGDLMADLHHHSTKVRALHTHEGHRNPGSPHRLPNGHMHFPSAHFPLVTGKSSYAYESPCSDGQELVFFIDEICALLDIRLGPFQLTLDAVRNR